MSRLQWRLRDSMPGRSGDAINQIRFFGQFYEQQIHVVATCIVDTCIVDTCIVDTCSHQPYICHH